MVVFINIFDGVHKNTTKEMRFTAKVNEFNPNNFGLFNMVGNVWEWTQDWFTRYHDLSKCEPCWSKNGNNKVIRGSFLCHDSYCNRYRTSARTSNSMDYQLQTWVLE